MRRRWVKLLGATLALWAAVLLTHATTMALHANLWWPASLTAFASPFFLAACVGLMWSAARQYVGPHPSLITLPVDPIERKVWGALVSKLVRPEPACGYQPAHPAHQFAHPDEDVDGRFGPARDCAGVPGDWTQPMDRDVTS